LTRGKRMVHFSLMMDSVREPYKTARIISMEKMLRKSADKPKEDASVKSSSIPCTWGIRAVFGYLH